MNTYRVALSDADGSVVDEQILHGDIELRNELNGAYLRIGDRDIYRTLSPRQWARIDPDGSVASAGARLTIARMN